MKESNRTETRTIHAPADQAPIRIDRFLADSSEVSRTAWQRAIRAAQVQLNGRLVDAAKVLVQGGDRIEVTASAVTAGAPMVAALEGFDPTKILYRDDALMVINKPKGLVVHPSRGHAEGTLVHYLLPWLEATDGDGEFRPGIVHRLDKDTTGCLVVARTAAIKEQMARAIAERRVDRWYLALCEGHMEPRTGVIDAPIGRDRKNRVRMAVERQGRAARTHFTTVMQWPHYSLLLLKLETGRTHQIRVHLSSLGHPLVGDGLYGGRPLGEFNSQALHAWRLGFEHPRTKTLLGFVAPLPLEWAGTWAGLGSVINPFSSSQIEEIPWAFGLGPVLAQTLATSGIQAHG